MQGLFILGKPYVSLNRVNIFTNYILKKFSLSKIKALSENIILNVFQIVHYQKQFHSINHFIGHQLKYFKIVLVRPQFFLYTSIYFILYLQILFHLNRSFLWWMKILIFLEPFFSIIHNPFPVLFFLHLLSFFPLPLFFFFLLPPSLVLLLPPSLVLLLPPFLVLLLPSSLVL